MRARLRWSIALASVQVITLAIEPSFLDAQPRLIRSVSGTKGREQAGVYVIEDPRTSFHYPEDEQVIVQFEWEGEAGRHQFEGRWRNPTGKAVVLSEFEYEAPGRRFGGYWVLKLGEGTTPGLWALEAVVDGQVAGLHAFQISATPIAPEGTAGKRLLTPAEIYDRTLPALVFIEKLGADGTSFATGSGFVVGEGRVLTTFEVIDGAQKLRVRFHDGGVQETERVSRWDRKRNWAILVVPTGDRMALTPAEPGSSAVGDRCYLFNAAGADSREIMDGRISGRQSFPDVGERISLEGLVGDTGTGSPVLDEHGGVVALATTGDLIPGIGSIRPVLFNLGNIPSDFRFRLMGVPVNDIPWHHVGDESTSFESLWAQRQFITPVTPNEHLTGGTVGKAIDRSDKRNPRVVGEGFEFPRTAGKVALVLRWNPLAKFESQISVRVFDSDNRALFQTEPQKLKLQAYTVAQSLMELDVTALPAGTYRVDAIVGQAPAWRSFFKLVDVR